MARVLLSISLFIYIVITNGWVLDVHYCMDQVSSVHLFDTRQELCSNCGMDLSSNNGCCHEEARMIKLVQDQQRVFISNYILDAPVSVNPAAKVDEITWLRAATGIENKGLLLPPDLHGQKRHIMNGVFRI